MTDDSPSPDEFTYLEQLIARVQAHADGDHDPLAIRAHFTEVLLEKHLPEDVSAEDALTLHFERWLAAATDDPDLPDPAELPDEVDLD